MGHRGRSPNRAHEPKGVIVKGCVAQPTASWVKRGRDERNAELLAARGNAHALGRCGAQINAGAARAGEEKLTAAHADISRPANERLVHSANKMAALSYANSCLHNV